MTNLESLLTTLYPDNFPALSKKLESLTKEASPPLKHQGDHRNLQLYVTYPDAFKVNGKRATLFTLRDNIQYISRLGMNALHILPFFDSPMIDMGFDVRDYLQIREDLGGNAAFEAVLSEASAHNMKIFVDMVLNHTSIEHEWFKKAQEGNEKYRNYYVHMSEKPVLLERFTDDMGIWAVYRIEGIPVKARIIFPEQAGELPHWIQGSDGYWYYHTFYPHQLDLDWNNPEVFLEFAQILHYWAGKGLHFRLDAVPFVGKRVKEAVTEGDEQVHVVLKALHAFLHTLGSESTFLIEVCQPSETTKEYFGDSQGVQAEFAYNFELMRSIWASLVAEHPEHIWDALESTLPLPHWGQWITFLRNHDELTLEFADPDVRTMIYTALHSKGLPFREDFGIAGRSMELLDNNPDRLIMAYFLLASLPGVPAIIYGDEIGKKNDLNNLHEQLKIKQKLDRAIIEIDARDANRGHIKQEDLNRKEALKIYNALSNIFTTRNEYPEISTAVPNKLENYSHHLFAAEYTLSDFYLRVFINLSDSSIDVPTHSQKVLLSTEEVVVNNDLAVLPAYGGVWLKKTLEDK